MKTNYDIWYDIFEDRLILCGPREYSVHDIILTGYYVYIGEL